MSQNYIENLRGMPVAERRRLLEGDWDFDDDDSVLFKLHLLQTTDAAPVDETTYSTRHGVVTRPSSRRSRAMSSSTN